MHRGQPLMSMWCHSRDQTALVLLCAKWLCSMQSRKQASLGAGYSLSFPFLALLFSFLIPSQTPALAQSATPNLLLALIPKSQPVIFSCRRSSQSPVDFSPGPHTVSLSTNFTHKELRVSGFLHLVSILDKNTSGGEPTLKAFPANCHNTRYKKW